MTLFKIDRKRCNRDLICAAECPARIIKADDSGYPEPVEDAGQNCISCGHCVAVCPQAAFKLGWLDPGDCPPVEKGLSIDRRQAEQFLRSRRSIRTFKDRPVEKEKLEKLIEIACYAPSAKNMQPWRWLVIRERNEMGRLAGLVIDYMRTVIEKDREAAEAMGLVRVVSAWDAGEDRVCRGAPHLIVVYGDKKWAFGLQDCTLAMSYLDLFAAALGLGTCWGGYVYTAINNYPPLFDALDLPSGNRAYGAMMVGYPEFEYRRMPLRKAPRIIWR